MRAMLQSVLGSKALCPYCFKRFAWAKSPFRCGSRTCAGSAAPDPELARNWPTIAPEQNGNTFIFTTRSREQNCPKCKVATAVRVCPECRINLPREWDRSRNAIIAIVGSKGSGKSHYIAASIHELKSRVAAEMNFSLEPMDDQTMRRFAGQYEGPLYHRRQQLTPTVSGLNADEIRLPLLFSLKVAGKNLIGRPKIKKSITLAFFDTAGEDLSNDRVMSSVNRYVAEAAGIIMLLDPTQLPQVRAQFKAPVASKIAVAQQEDVFTRVTRLIRDLRHLGEKTILPIPVSIVLSKFDQLKSIVPGDLEVFNPARLEKLYDPVAAKIVIDQVESLLEKWDCHDILNQIRTNYSRYSFFGVSATGCAPDPVTLQYPMIKSVRVEDPFLWILHGIGFFKGKK